MKTRISDKLTKLVLIGLCIFLALVFLVSGINDLTFVSLGSIADEDIFATKTVFDKIKYDLILDDLRDKSIVYDLDFKTMNDALERFKNTVKSVREHKSSNFPSYISFFQFNNDERVISYEVYSFIFDLKDSEVSRFSNLVTNSLLSYYSFGIKVEEVDFLVDEILNSIDTIFIIRNESYSDSLRVFLKDFLVPNKAIDIQASLKLFEDSKEATPRPFVEYGSKIIGKGEVVDERIYYLLDSLDLVLKPRTLMTALVRSIIMSLAVYLILLKHISFEDSIIRKKIVAIFTLYLLYSVLIAFLSDFVMLASHGVLVILIFALTSYKERLAHCLTVAFINFGVYNNFALAFSVLTVGVIFMIVSKEYDRRSNIFYNSLLFSIINTVVFSLLFPSRVTSFANFLAITLQSLLVGLMSIGIVFIALVFFETLLGSSTRFGLIEMASLDNPLLKRLSKEAPGTYQHSIAVSNIAEAIAEAIGANSQLAKVGGLYHDIGKLRNPLNFKENQNNIPNPHDTLSSQQSLEILFDHVSFGYELGKKNKLYSDILSIIKEHHGNTIAKYFYYRDTKQGLILPEEKYRYPQSIPLSKESAIIMISDCCEAAVRSLDNYSEADISKMVNSIIDDKIKDGQLDDSGLELKNINAMRKVVIDIMVSLYHSRIKY